MFKSIKNWKYKRDLKKRVAKAERVEELCFHRKYTAKSLVNKYCNPRNFAINWQYTEERNAAKKRLFVAERRHRAAEIRLACLREALAFAS